MSDHPFGLLYDRAQVEGEDNPAGQDVMDIDITLTNFHPDLCLPSLMNPSCSEPYTQSLVYPDESLITYQADNYDPFSMLPPLAPTSVEHQIPGFDNFQPPATTYEDNLNSSNFLNSTLEHRYPLLPQDPQQLLITQMQHHIQLVHSQQHQLLQQLQSQQMFINQVTPLLAQFTSVHDSLQQLAQSQTAEVMCRVLMTISESSQFAL